MTDGTPLPLSLSGVIVERVVKIDSALLYLIDGAWAYLLDREPLEQTGVLTVENARNALSDAFYVYLWEDAVIVPIGTVLMWPNATPPDGWLLCNNQSVAKDDYPDLYAVLGATYGETSTTFRVPDFRGRSPYGVDVSRPAVGTLAGAELHTLTIAEMPNHNHGAVVSPTSPDANRALVSSGGAFLVQDSVTVNTGGGGAHNNLHPISTINFIIYAGRT